MNDNTELLAISKRIYNRRKQLNLTQEKLAELADITAQAVSYAENGSRRLGSEPLLKIAQALNVSVDYLLTGNISDQDLILLSDKLRRLPPTMFHSIENIIDECLNLVNNSHKTD